MRKASSEKSTTKKKMPLSAAKPTSQKPGAGKQSHTSLKGQRTVLKLKKAVSPKHRIVTSKEAEASVTRKLRPPVTSLPKVKASISKSKGSAVNHAKSAALKQYESAIKMMYSQNFEGARIAFERILEANPEDKEIRERVKLHLRLCEQKMARKPSSPRTLEEHYDLGVALMNQGRFDEAREQFQKALKINSKCEFAIYALASLSSRIGDLEGAISSLKTAIQLRSENRILAQHDSDFEPLSQDTRFRSLVFPVRLTSGTS